MILLAILGLAAVTHGQPVDPNASDLAPHEAAIKLFASTLAMADVASRNCADILINLPMLDGLRDRLGVSIDDRRALKVETDFALKVFEKALKDAPSPQAWCDSAYRMYGPDGRMIRGFMMRSSTPQAP